MLSIHDIFVPHDGLQDLLHERMLSKLDFKSATRKETLTRNITVAQELGLHREQSCLDIGPEFHTKRDLNVEASTPRLQPEDVDLKEFENSAKVMLFWCVFIHDTCLVSQLSDKSSIQPWAPQSVMAD